MTADRRRSLFTLLVFLLAAHALYAAAWQAGWVRDVTGWLQSLHTQSFSDYLLRRGKHVQSLYPFTQWTLWLTYKAFGVSPLAWHLLMVSAHAVVAWGWTRCGRRLLIDAGIRGAEIIALFGGLFFLLSPYATEVVVWEAGFHYLQGMLLQLGVLYCVLRWIRSGKMSAAWVAALLFVPAVLSLEVFLLTPVYTLLVLVWYRNFKLLENYRFRLGLVLFLLPQLVLCLLQYVAFRVLYSYSVPHIGALHASWIADYVRKPGKYMFHVLLDGRYWPAVIRVGAYRVLNSWPFLVLFYGGGLLFLVQVWRRWKGLGAVQQAGCFLGLFAAAVLVLMMPMHFHEEGLVYFDRYAYFLLPPAGMLLGLLLYKLPFSRVSMPVVWLTQAALLLGTVLLWRESDAMSKRMLQSLPEAEVGKTTVLLNVPNAMNGVPMIGATQEGEAALMLRYVLGHPYRGRLLEPSACNLEKTTDDVVIRKTGPATLAVTLPDNEGWWSGGVPTGNWENDVFSVKLPNPECCYELDLKKPADSVVLLLWQKDRWDRVATVKE